MVYRNIFFILSILFLPFSLRPSPFLELEEVEDLVKKEYDRIHRTNEVYTLVAETAHFSRKIYCKYECYCYADRFASILRLNHTIINMYIVVVKGGAEGVRILRQRGGVVDERPSRYDYHAALFVMSRNGSIKVIDPIMFGDPLLRDPILWHNHILQGHYLKFEIRPQ